VPPFLRKGYLGNAAPPGRDTRYAAPCGFGGGKGYAGEKTGGALKGGGRKTVEALFNGNTVFIFFFAMIAIYNYSDLKEYQRIAIIYITVYSLIVTDIIGVKLAVIFLFLTMFCFLEILTKDETKFKIIVSPLYKILDCLYLSFFQYSFMGILLAVVLWNLHSKIAFCGNEAIFRALSIVLMILALTHTLQQKFVINSFADMYRIFVEFPINKVNFNDKLDEACQILVSIEDRTYYERRGYTFLSISTVKHILKRSLRYCKFRDKLKYTCSVGKKFVKNVLKEDRGYSTIPMQLIRTLGVKRGYNYKYRRKIFEFLYSRMFFNGVKRMLREDQVAQRENIKKYYLYIYFHKVNTFLGDAKFSKFLNAFDMQYGNRNKKDIYECSNEGIFIACMGLSKRADKLNEDNIDYYLSLIEGLELDGKIICEMVSKMMEKPYDGNYLK